MTTHQNPQSILFIDYEGAVGDDLLYAIAVGAIDAGGWDVTRPTDDLDELIPCAIVAYLLNRAGRWALTPAAKLGLDLADMRLKATVVGDHLFLPAVFVRWLAAVAFPHPEAR